MNTMTIDQLIAYLKDFKQQLVPGKQLYVKIKGEILICTDRECKRIEASI